MEISQIAHGTPHYDAAVALRDQLLRRPLGLEFTSEQLAGENRCIHIGAFERDQLVGCLVLVPKDAVRVQMRQVAVHPDYQRDGVGTRMVKFAEHVARDNGFRKMTLNARKTAVPFYEKLGYTTVGDEFIEITIPHFPMEKDLG